MYTGKMTVEDWVRENSAGRKWKILIDGKEAERCVEADSEKGYVVCHALNEKGNAYAIGDIVATKTTYGKVEFLLEKNA